MTPVPQEQGDEGLIERLHDASAYCGALSDVNHLFDEAAARIAELERVVERVRQALIHIKSEADRTEGRWVHMKRCIAVQTNDALEAIQEKD